MNPAFWKGRRVLVTGHTGFKGSWLSLWLQSLGADVCGYALAAPTDPSLYELAQVEAGMESVIGNLKDRALLRDTLERFQPEVVLHLAAQPLVLESYRDPIETLETNVIGTANLLEAARNVGSVRAVVVVTTDKCYENKEWAWGYREDEPLGGRDPYSASKACAELVTATYRASFFQGQSAAIASARAGNVIGGGDFAKDRLISDIMNGIRSGVTIKIRSPEAIRPWQHVLEPLAGYLMLAEALLERGGDFARAWNFGPFEQEVRSVRWICDFLTERWTPRGRWVLDEDSYPHEANYLKLDASLARQVLGWQPKLSLDECLSWILEWNQGLYAGKDARQLTDAQIRRYQAL